jgi:hypothetical protein
MDGSSFRKQVLLDLAMSPFVLLPAAAGMTMLLGSWAVGAATELLAFAGVAGLLAGLGALVTRWITSRDKIAKRVFARNQAARAADKERSLDDLAAQLERDEDPWTGQALATLRGLADRFRDLLDPAKTARTPPVEIAGTVQRLLDYSVESLKGSYRLWETAQKVLTAEARRDVLDKREKLLIEVDHSITQIAKAIDDLHTLGLDTGPASDLAQMRQELQENLDVARKVERRMHELESELNPGARLSE